MSISDKLNAIRKLTDEIENLLENQDEQEPYEAFKRVIDVLSDECKNAYYIYWEDEETCFLMDIRIDDDIKKIIGI